MARAVILAATIAALITAYLERPEPVHVVTVRYCLADADDPRMFAPCNETKDYRADI